jgi:hypothetical protein
VALQRGRDEAAVRDNQIRREAFLEPLAVDAVGQGSAKVDVRRDRMRVVE